MQTQAFREYLTARQFQSAEIDSQVAFVQRIEGNLQYKMPSCSLEDLNQASTQDLVNDLIDQGENSIENLQYLARYAWAINNQDMYNALFEMLDGCEAMDNLYKKLGDYAGEDLREIIFEEMPLPPLGLSRREKSRYTYRIMHRMKLIFEEKTIKDLLKDCLRDLPDSLYGDEKKDYYDLCDGDIDRYLILKGERFLQNLVNCKLEGKTFFGQVITDEVIKFVKENPQIGQGVREGSIIFETKIPYNTQAYLLSSDYDEKRYHYCHCPWAKESLKTGALLVPACFCQCSAGFHKKRYELIYEQPLKAEVIQSVLRGDMVCQFAIHLPE